ncbi:hypothetical protein CAP35_14525 [Chitinophagaceae bacterium IBVUCB1]|nr:hypothetical protein CAP35_14525 [Chitinophagaceae bacterium IBVUCB1]
MKKIVSSLIFIVLVAASADAQFRYTVSVSTATYTPLTMGTVLTGTDLWDDEYYTAPIGFNFNMESLQINKISMIGGGFAASDTIGNVSGFFLTGADLYDRGNAGGTNAVSPIRYAVTGNAGSRIFKMEVHNAGFWDEYDLYTTNNDSVSYQIWLYEGSNVVELHYGPSKVSHPTDYFFLSSGKSLIGYVKNIDYDNGNLEKMYYLNGNQMSPTIDSSTDLTSVSGGLNAYPANGTVYRFTPIPTGVGNITKTLEGVSIVNTVSTSNITVNNTEQNKVTYRVVSSNGTSTNISGQLMMGANRLDISSLPTGVYLLQAQSEEGYMVQRIVKQ